MLQYLVVLVKGKIDRSSHVQIAIYGDDSNEGKVRMGPEWQVHSPKFQAEDSLAFQSEM